MPETDEEMAMEMGGAMRSEAEAKEIRLTLAKEKTKRTRKTSLEFQLKTLKLYLHFFKLYNFIYE